MLGSGSAGNSALVATEHCKVLIDGGLSARQLVLRLELCGVTPEQLDGVLLTHEHGDHICGLEVFCRKFNVPIYSNALTAESVRGDGAFEAHTATGGSLRPAPSFPFAISLCKRSSSRTTRWIRWGSCFTPVQAASVYYRPRLRDQVDR
jgi:phosphoribosyl 1,2-cyclic phosphodiesterase